MADRSILYRLRAALQGGFVSVAQEVQTLATFRGVLAGSANVETGLQRFDATGVGTPLFPFTGSYSAQNSNIDEWFGGRQTVRLRCTDSGFGTGSSGTVTFDLPGSTALNTAFDQLVAVIPTADTLTFIIEYTGANKDRLSIRPRASGTGPQISGVSNIIVRSGVAARLEVTRINSVLSDYMFQDIGLISEGGDTFDSLKLQNPADVIWDASPTGTLPTDVQKGYAYKVFNAPSDGSGRFGEVMQDGDWVVWEGQTFTSWASEPHAWFVIPAHMVRRITALEDEFLSFTQISDVSDRNTVVRGSDYADSAGEIRLKIYPTVGDYTAADLNTTGDVDAYTDTSNQSGILAVRLSGTNSSLSTVLPNLYAYVEQANGDFILLGNLVRDFNYQGDFGAESDYTSNFNINYIANQTIRIFEGTVIDRFTNPNLDVTEAMLTEAVQHKLNNTSGGGAVDDQRLNAIESKVDALYPLTPDVTQLTEWGAIVGPSRSVQEVDITTGYTKIADFRDDSTRYESSGVVYTAGSGVVTYTGLGTNLYRTFGFKVTAPSDQTLLWLVDGSTRIPYIDVTATGNFRINSYRNEIGEDEVITNQSHFLTKTAGPATLAQNDGQVQTFTITNFPANASNTSRTIQVGTDVFLNGVNTQAEHLLTIDLPATNTAQSRRTLDSSIPLGPLHGNRVVNITFGYTLRVSGSDLLIDFNLITAPSDITVDMEDVVVFLNYTAPGAVSRVDNFVNFQDANGDYTFTGENELLVTFHPFQINNLLEAVAAVADSTGNTTEFNDINTPIPAHTFESVEIPNTIDFRTFSPTHFLRHSDLSALLGRRNVQWCYGLATLLTVRELSITSAVDFTAPTENTNRLVSVRTGTAAPTVTPQFIGQLFVDTTNKTIYAAADTGSDGDWEQLN